jgi:plastocyanin
MKLIAGIVLILIIAGGGWFYMQKNTVDNETQGTPAAEETGGITNTMPAIETVTVEYTDKEFSPAAVTIGMGSTVTWHNKSKVKMWVASAMHPAHTTYNGSSLSEHCEKGVPASADIFDQCVGIEPGGSWSFTFTKAGEWKYHDHITSGRYGMVTVVDGAPTVLDDADAAR